MKERGQDQGRDREGSGRTQGAPPLPHGRGSDPRLADRLLAVAGLPTGDALEVLQRDQIERWQRGERVPAEHYLALHPGLADEPEAAFDLICGEFVLRQQLGETPDLAEYLRRFPRHADGLRLLAELEQALDTPVREDTPPGFSVVAAPPEEPAGPPSSGSNVGELTELFRRRLRLAASCVALFFLLVLLLLQDPPDFAPALQALGRGGQLLAGASLAYSVTLAIVLRRAGWSLATLHRLDLAHVAVAAALSAALRLGGDLADPPPGVGADSPYWQQVRAGETLRNNFVWFSFIFTYGVVMPNTGRRCAAVVSVLTAIPLMITAGTALAAGQPRERLVMELVSSAGALAFAAAMGTFGAHRLSTLQREVARARREARELGQYRLGRRLGVGGMGEVYLAEHRLLKRPCAIKLIRPERSGDSQFVRRFSREVRATAQLTHPHIVQVYDYGQTEDGRFYYVMEYLPGLTLEELVARDGRLSPGRVVRLLRQLCGALGEAHGVGLIHRDIKPSNVIVVDRGGPDGVAKLLDFGLVGRLPTAAADSGASLEEHFCGTPAYMAPEQVEGGPIDARTDLYSLGALAYFLLTGRPPFQHATAARTLLAHLHDPVPPFTPADPPVPADLRDAVWRCLAKDPAGRFASAAELDEALARAVGQVADLPAGQRPAPQS